MNAHTTQPQPCSVNIECGCVPVLYIGSHISHHFSYYPADSTRTMSEDFMLMEMPGAFERGQYGDYGLARPDVVRFVIDAN